MLYLQVLRTKGTTSNQHDGMIHEIIVTSSHNATSSGIDTSHSEVEAKPQREVEEEHVP